MFEFVGMFAAVLYLFCGVALMEALSGGKKAKTLWDVMIYVLGYIFWPPVLVYLVARAAVAQAAVRK